MYFDVALGVLPEIYDDFLSRVKHTFIPSDAGQFIFSYRINAAGYEEINIPSMPHKDGHPDEYSYIRPLAKPQGDSTQRHEDAKARRRLQRYQ